MHILSLNDDVLLHEDAARGLSVVARREYRADFLTLLERTDFGTEGLRYRRLGLVEQLQRLGPAVFIELRQQEKLLGTYVLGSRRLRVGSENVAGVYRGLLALAPEAQGRGLGRHVVEHTFAWLRDQSGDQPSFSWGCIESGNSRSRKLLESLGARTHGSLDSLLTYRQWPRRRTDIDESLETASIAAALQQAYGDCGLRLIDPSPGHYFAVTGNDGIVAGARATLTRVDMLSSGSTWDFLYDKLLRRVPAARRRYDPRNFRYLRLTDVVAVPGHERIWRDFLGTLLARHSVHMAMFVLDRRSHTYTALHRAGLFGRFAESTRQRIDVLTNAWNMPQDLLAGIADKPLAIGPLDI